MKTLVKTLEQMKTAMDDIRLEVERVRCPNVETNTTIRNYSEDIPI